MYDARLNGRYAAERDSRRRQILGQIRAETKGQIRQLRELARRVIESSTGGDDAARPVGEDADSFRGQARTVAEVLRNWRFGGGRAETAEALFAAELVGDLIASRLLKPESVQECQDLVGRIRHDWEVMVAAEAKIQAARTTGRRLPDALLEAVTCFPDNAKDWLRVGRRRPEGGNIVFPPPEHPRQIWNEHQNVYGLLNDTVDARIWWVGKLCPERLASILDSRVGLAMRAEIASQVHLSSDKELCLLTIRTSNPCISNDQWSGNAAALVAVDAYVAYVRALRHAVIAAVDDAPPVQLRGERREHATFDTGELIELVDILLDELASRSVDGIWLLLELGVELLGRLVRSQSRDANAEFVYEKLVDRLTDKLAEIGVDVATCQRHAAALRDTGVRSSFTDLLLASIVERSRANSNFASNSELVWSWYGDLVRCSDETLSYHVGETLPAPTWVFDCLSWPLTLVDAPSEEWLHLWNGIQGGRLKSNRSSVGASWHLLYVGRAALIPLFQARSPDLVSRMWEQLLVAANLLRFADFHTHPGDVAQLRGSFFAFVPVLWPGAERATLGIFAPLLRVDDAFCVHASLLLLQNGSTPFALRDALEDLSIDPVAASQRELEWQELAHSDSRAVTTFREWHQKLQRAFNQAQ